MIVAGILTPLENVMSHILVWLHLTIGLPWAWSIVALTIIVRFLLVPVAVRQIHSMQSLQMHAPEMKAIQQRWKHDRQRQQEELMKFYRENKINPYASCLPLVFQIPIFIALYYTLRHFETRIQVHDPGASIDWLNLVNINEHTSVGWGPLLLVIYVVSQLTSSYFMSTQMQSNAQRAMIMFLPVVFVAPLSGGSHDLLGHHQPLDDGAGPRHAPAHPSSGRSAETHEQDTAERGSSSGAAGFGSS